MGSETAIKRGYRIGELSGITGVKSGTIRFYEKCGFIETAARLPNNYRVFNERHIYQVRVCRLVFCGFVSHKLRKASMELIEAARAWDLAGYERAAAEYVDMIDGEIERTKKVIETVICDMGIQYLKSLAELREKAMELYLLADEMKKIC